MTSALFRYIEGLQGDAPWGDFLDAGTGVNSALWSKALDLTSLTAVSGSAEHLAQVRDRLGDDLAHEHQLVEGNWANPDLLSGRAFDTVLADYLVGAIEGFAPYFQGRLFARLRPLVRNRLYVVGLDPYVVGPSVSEADRIVREIGRLRDAILLLADETPYREFPAEWTIAALVDAGFEIVASKRFPNRYRARWIQSQLDMALRRLSRLSHELRSPFLAEIERLRRLGLAVCEREQGLRSGSDYVIAAR
jgi:hypothetical protein